MEWRVSEIKMFNIVVANHTSASIILAYDTNEREKIVAHTYLTNHFSCVQHASNIGHFSCFKFASLQTTTKVRVLRAYEFGSFWFCHRNSHSTQHVPIQPHIQSVCAYRKIYVYYEYIGCIWMFKNLYVWFFFLYSFSVQIVACVWWFFG